MKFLFPKIIKGIVIITILIGCARINEPTTDDPASILLSGLFAGYMGQYDAAIAAFNKAIRLNPTDVRAYNFRGYAYFCKGQYDKAIADYSMAIEINHGFSPKK